MAGVDIVNAYLLHSVRSRERGNFKRDTLSSNLMFIMMAVCTQPSGVPLLCPPPDLIEIPTLVHRFLSGTICVKLRVPVLQNRREIGMTHQRLSKIVDAVA